ASGSRASACCSLLASAGRSAAEPVLLRVRNPDSRVSMEARMRDKPLDVVGIGNAIVDVLAQASDSFIAEQELPKGSMTLIDMSRAESLYSAMGPAVEVSGGSCANTMAGVASLGGQGGFIGK